MPWTGLEGGPWQREYPRFGGSRLHQQMDSNIMPYSNRMYNDLASGPMMQHRLHYDGSGGYPAAPNSNSGFPQNYYNSDNVPVEYTNYANPYSMDGASTGNHREWGKYGDRVLAPSRESYETEWQARYCSPNSSRDRYHTSSRDFGPSRQEYWERPYHSLRNDPYHEGTEYRWRRENDRSRSTYSSRSGYTSVSFSRNERTKNEGSKRYLPQQIKKKNSHFCHTCLIKCADCRSFTEHMKSSDHRKKKEQAFRPLVNSEKKLSESLPATPETTDGIGPDEISTVIKVPLLGRTDKKQDISSAEDKCKEMAVIHEKPIEQIAASHQKGIEVIKIAQMPEECKSTQIEPKLAVTYTLTESRIGDCVMDSHLPLEINQPKKFQDVIKPSTQIMEVMKDCVPDPSSMGMMDTVENPKEVITMEGKIKECADTNITIGEDIPDCVTKIKNRELVDVVTKLAERLDIGDMSIGNVEICQESIKNETVELAKERVPGKRKHFNEGVLNSGESSKDTTINKSKKLKQNSKPSTSLKKIKVLDQNNGQMSDGTNHRVCPQYAEGSASTRGNPEGAAGTRGYVRHQIVINGLHERMPSENAVDDRQEKDYQDTKDILCKPTDIIAGQDGNAINMHEQRENTNKPTKKLKHAGISTSIQRSILGASELTVNFEPNVDLTNIAQPSTGEESVQVKVEPTSGYVETSARNQICAMRNEEKKPVVVLERLSDELVYWHLRFHRLSLFL